MTLFIETADGTRIAYDRQGLGQAVIFVDGAFQFRASDPASAELAAALASDGFTVLRYDRPGRGESGGGAPFTLDGEIAAIRALIGQVDGPVALYGSSSGGVIGLAAAAAGLPVDRLVLWEPPLGDEQGADGAEFLAGLRERIAAGDRGATVEFFMRDMPLEWLEQAKQGPAWPMMISVAETLEADSEALAWTQSGSSRKDLWKDVTVSALVLLGEETLPIFPPAADSIVGSLADARQARIPGSGHQWAVEDMVPVLADFLRAE